MKEVVAMGGVAVHVEKEVVRLQICKGEGEEKEEEEEKEEDAVPTGRSSYSHKRATKCVVHVDARK